MNADNFVLVVTDHVPYVNPLDYGVPPIDGLNQAGVNPNDYFVTSGDAVDKAVVLESDMWAEAGNARRLLKKSEVASHCAYVTALWAAAGKCRALVNMLRRVRGNAIWLETDWLDHRLVCVPKNPRHRDDQT